MPARSEAQRRLLNAKFGHAWVKKHHFDNKGKLPERVSKVKKGKSEEMGEYGEKAPKHSKKKAKKGKKSKGKKSSGGMGMHNNCTYS